MGDVMTIDEAMALLRCADSEFLSVAGPAVLRLKLLEVTHLAQRRRLPEEMREAARVATTELRQLIVERPCTSLVDSLAQMDVTGAPRGRSLSRLGHVAGHVAELVAEHVAEQIAGPAPEPAARHA